MRSREGGEEPHFDVVLCASYAEDAAGEDWPSMATADAVGDLTGAVRGELATAALLADDVVRASARMVEFNLAGASSDTASRSR